MMIMFRFRTVTIFHFFLFCLLASNGLSFSSRSHGQAKPKAILTPGPPLYASTAASASSSSSSSSSSVAVVGSSLFQSNSQIAALPRSIHPIHAAFVKVRKRSSDSPVNKNNLFRSWIYVLLLTFPYFPIYSTRFILHVSFYTMDRLE